MEEKIKFKSLNEELVGIIDYPKKLPAPGVLFFHGLSNSKNDCPLINETSRSLVKNGYITFRFDQFGSGESPGTMMDKTFSILEQNTNDALDYFVENNYVTNIGLWGRSTGGTQVGICKINDRIKASVIISGAFFLTEVFNKNRIEKLHKKQKDLEKIGESLPGTGSYKGNYNLNLEWYDEYKMHYYENKLKSNISKIKNLLVLGAIPDEKVFVKNSIEFYNFAKPPKELHIFSNTNHAYNGAEKEAVSLILRWFKMYLR